MPHNPQSARLTDAYRARKRLIADRVERSAREAWPRIQDLDTTPWPDFMAAEVSRAQVEGIRLTAGYLGAFLRSETGKGTVPVIDSRRYAGQSRDGRPLSEALVSPLIGVRAKLKEGIPASAALAHGLQRALRMVGFEAMQTPRDALLDTISESDQFRGFERDVAGTCAACEALSGTGGPRFEVHPNCECEPSPLITALVNTSPLPTGAALFAAKTKAEQDASIGPEAAELVRGGHAELTDFVSHSPQAEQPDFITQKPVEQVT